MRINGATKKSNPRQQQVKALINDALRQGFESVDRVSASVEDSLRPPEIPSNTTETSPVHNQSPASSVKPSLPANELSEAAFLQGLNKLIAKTGGKVKISSHKRSTQRQTELWNQALKKYGSPEKARKWVAPPGRSLHEKGLAADLSYADDATRKLVHQLAKEHGLHFPLSNEPWHIEPLGARKR